MAPGALVETLGPEGRMGIGRRLLTGATAGLGGTLAMSAVMLAARRAGLTGKLPPRRITQRVLDRLRLRRSERMDEALTVGTHLGYGMATGALFSVLGPRMRQMPLVLAGAAFGGLVWVTSYFGWVPALGLMPSPAEDRPDRSVSMLTAHLVYGAVLGALTPPAGRESLEL